MTLEKYITVQLINVNGYALRKDAETRLRRLKTRQLWGKRLCALVFSLFVRKKG